jgi:hypothetical protein
MNDYIELESKVRSDAAAKWNEENLSKYNLEDYAQKKSADRDRIAALRAATEKWFLASELYSSIIIRREAKVVEIRDGYYGSSITVYAPERTYDFSEDSGKKPVIRPAYMNASTWDTGSYSATIDHVQRRTLHYVKMLEIAFDTQNEMNQVLIDWVDMRNPISGSRWEKEELERYRQEHRERAETERQKAVEKAQKKAVRA